MRIDSMIGTDKIRNDMTVKLCIFIQYSEFFSNVCRLHRSQLNIVSERV